MVHQFISCLRSSKSPWGKVELSQEFDYRRGRVDVVALTEEGGQLMAFEAKLVEWRRALHQAQRNRCLAHRSYVLLPREAATVAQRYGAEFARRNVGLCSLHEGVVSLIFSPVSQAPLEPWLFEEAAAKTRGPFRASK
jgi:hypothetical protein